MEFDDFFSKNFHGNFISKFNFIILKIFINCTYPRLIDDTCLFCLLFLFLFLSIIFLSFFPHDSNKVPASYKYLFVFGVDWYLFALPLL